MFMTLIWLHCLSIFFFLNDPATPKSSPLPLPDPLPILQARKVRNGLATALIIAAFLIAVVPLVAVIAWVIQKGSSVLSWNFLTKDPPIIDQLPGGGMRSEEHTSELQSQSNIVCRLLL